MAIRSASTRARSRSGPAKSAAHWSTYISRSSASVSRSLDFSSSQRGSPSPIAERRFRTNSGCQAESGPIPVPETYTSLVTRSGCASA